MNGNSFYVIAVAKENKAYAYAKPIPNCNNLVGICRDKNVVSVNACKTLKEAWRIAEMWNDGYKKAGTFYYE